MSDSGSPAPSATSTTNRRQSSRTKRQPEHFASSPFTNGSGGGKRKRGEAAHYIDEDINMVEDDDEAEEDDEESEEEPDEEELREQAKKARKLKKAAAPKKPPQKKAKTNAMPNGITLPIRGTTKAPAKKRPPKKAKAIDAAEAEAAGGLYADLFARDKSIEEVVAGWLKAFEQHESRSLADVINFVLKSAGCDAKLTEHDIEDPDGAMAKLTDIQDEHQATNPTDYPLIAKGNAAKAFRASITHFMHTLTKAIAASGLMSSNPELVENIHVWFSTMSSASNRGFRHTATVVSLSLLSALCEIAKECAEKAATNQRQAEMESKKSKVNKDRVKQIGQKVKDASADLEVANAHIKDWFDTIFIHRYRDVDAAVRRECIEALGDWIITMPDTFFDGQHLRYLGWLLSDESAASRSEVIKQLRRLYSDSGKLGGLKTFTERFRARLVEIGTSDADISVRISGIELLDVLRENDLLEPDDIDAVGKLIFHEEVKVRTAVAGFFSENVNELFTSKAEDLGGVESLVETLPDVSEDNFEAPRLAWLKYKSLAEMLQSYDQADSESTQFARNASDGSLVLNVMGNETRFTLAANALFSKIDELKDWQALVGYLLFDHSAGRANGVSDDVLAQLKHESVLSEEEELVLLEVLNASVKRSLNDLAQEQITHKGKLNKKQKETLQENIEDAVRSLTDAIPKLLKKFGDTPNTAAAVLRLEGVLALPALQSLRQDPTANNAFLDDLRKQFMSHGTDEVLRPATAAILHAQSYGELDDSALDKINSLWEDVVGNLTELLNVKTITVRGASMPEELVALSNNLLRIVRLAAVSNCVAPLEDEGVAIDGPAGKKYKGAIDFIIDLVERAIQSSGPVPDPEDAALEDLIAARAAEAALFYFRWKFSALMKALKAGSKTELSYDRLEPFAERRDGYLDRLLLIVDERKTNEQVCFSAAGCLLDLHVSAAVVKTEKPKLGVNDAYEVLLIDMNSRHQQAVMKVFATYEKEFAKLTGKKLEGPVQDEEEMDIDADPIDDDPVSDAEEEDEDGAQTQASQQARDAKLVKPLIAEQRLCLLTTKIIQAVIAGVIDEKPTQKRIQRNKTRLGHNFKEVLTYLDVAAINKKKAKMKAPKAKVVTNGNTNKGKSKDPKSNAIVAEDEIEDEIEDDEDDVDPRVEGEEADEDMVNGAPAEEESVAGD